MKSILSTLFIGIFLAMTPTLAMASDCNCSKQCHSECAKGNGKNCKCKTCDCSKTGKCSHGACKMKNMKAKTEAEAS